MNAPAEKLPSAAMRWGAVPNSLRQGAIARLPLPDRETMNALAPFEALTIDQVQVVTTADAADTLLARWQAGIVLGFDTESRPTFRVGEQSEGPHVVQFATSEAAWIFQVGEAAVLPALQAILSSPAITKVGFGLGSDIANINRRLGVQPQGLVDLCAKFGALGYRKTVGVKHAVAMLFGRRLQKSKSVSTTNWAARTLTPQQILYAANDAWAAIRVHEVLATPEGQARLRSSGPR